MKVKTLDIVRAKEIREDLSGQSALETIMQEKLQGPVLYQLALWDKAITNIMDSYSAAQNKLVRRIGKTNEDEDPVIKVGSPEHEEYRQHMNRVHQIEVDLSVEQLRLEDVDVDLPPKAVSLCWFIFEDFAEDEESDVPDFEAVLGLEEEE